MSYNVNINIGSSFEQTCKAHTPDVTVHTKIKDIGPLVPGTKVLNSGNPDQTTAPDQGLQCYL